jgi:hypothetical protein
VTEKDAARERDAVSAVTEVAAMLIKATLTMPISTMKAACNLQMRVLEMMERLIPGVDANPAAGAGGGPGTPSTGAPAPAAPSTPRSLGGWRPVTLQDPSTGWGPMPDS